MQFERVIASHHSSSSMNFVNIHYLVLRSPLTILFRLFCGGFHIVFISTIHTFFVRTPTISVVVDVFNLLFIL